MAVTWDKMPASRPGTNYQFNTTSTSQATSAFGSQCFQIRIATGGQTVWVKVGDGTPTAATTGDSMIVGANVIDYVTVTPGQRAAVVGGTAGPVSITEMS
jgi:hypothetical protein